MNSKTRVLNVLVTGLALFAMFFGAGNLIFPVMIGVESGVEQVPATIGFMLTLSLIHISEPTRREWLSRMPSSA